MTMKKNNLFLLFLAGLSIPLLILPLLKMLGVPTYDVVLVELFGEGSKFAILFSLVLVSIIVLGLMKVVKRKA
ncbi:hypothetical protein [Bacillus suaedae]|uniref:Uncharacterized protein n=1 Tax=Halalkalibacter suaedae TaxID=2822140 RepID=A0A941ARY6_9BACI|nr:hypothetical protein [Bacillus suaedae]MBP3953518.1 hypothetical protein [Bacillus suaedae]